MRLDNGARRYYSRAKSPSRAIAMAWRTSTGESSRTATQSRALGTLPAESARSCGDRRLHLTRVTLLTSARPEGRAFLPLPANRLPPARLLRPRARMFRPKSASRRWRVPQLVQEICPSQSAGSRRRSRRQPISKSRCCTTRWQRATRVPACETGAISSPERSVDNRRRSLEASPLKARVSSNQS
jgi:hypothetical protein